MNKYVLSALVVLISSLSLSALASEIIPLSQRSSLDIPNQTEYSDFGALRDKRRLGFGAGFQGIPSDFTFVTEVHLFESQSLRMNISPDLDNLFFSAGLKSWINDEIFSPYWTVEGWNLSKRRDENTNGIASAIGLQFNKINEGSAGTSLFLEVMGLADFKKFGLKMAAAGGLVYNF